MHEVLDFLFNEWLVGFGVPILISAGFAFIGDEFRAFKWARICFVTSAAWICGKTLMWSVFSLDSFRSKAVVVFFACGFVGVALLAVLVLTTKREAEVAATPEKMQVGKKPSVVMTAYLQPTEEPYSQGMAVGGIVWSRNYMDVRLDIVNGPVEIKDLDFYVQLTDTSIAGIGQISQLQGMTVLPANEFPAVWLAGTDTKGQPESIPIVPTPGLMRSSPVYRVHCSEIFANAVTHLVIASVALNPTENGHLPQQLFAPRRAPKAISVKGNYDTQKAGGGVENHPIEFWYSFQQITEGSRAGAVEQLSPAERPYVIAETATFIDDDNKVRVEFHNSGKTPAVDLGLSIRFLIGNAFDLDGVTPEQLAQPTGYGNVGADQRVFTIVDTHKLDHPVEFESAKKGQLDCYALGFLRYKDIAGREYEPRYCFKWSAQYQAFERCPANKFVKDQKL